MTKKARPTAPAGIPAGWKTPYCDNIVIIELDGNPNGKVSYYEISSGTVHTVRLYMAYEDSFFIYNGRRRYLKEFI